MKAIRINQPGEVEIFETEKPVPKKGEALLKILYGGICGSDLGSIAARLPMLLIRVSRVMNFRRKSWKSEKMTVGSRRA